MAATETNVVNEQGLLPEEMTEMPTFLNTPNCDKTLVEETRNLLKQRYLDTPDSFYKTDYDLIMTDDWYVTRFLLRCRLDPQKSVDLMEAASKFRREFKMSEAKPGHFPSELFEVGAIFKYAPDRVGNTTLWMRVKYHRRSSEMVHIMKQFILCIMEECDQESKGRGIAVVFDMSECGLKNADPSFLYWLLMSFRTYCPKGLSYILVYNLPWVFSGICSTAMAWLSSTNRKRLRFIEGEEINKFIASENLPDFIPGGTCKLDYKSIPHDSKPAEARSGEEGNPVPIDDNLAKKIKEMHTKLTTCFEN